MTVSQLSAEELLRLWESGVPLDSAWEEFVDSFLLTVLRAHPNKDPGLFGLHNPGYKELVKAGLPNTEEGRKKKLEIVAQDARACLLRELYAGRRWAIGFQTSSSGSSQATHLSRELFSTDEAGESRHHPEVDWGGSAITVGDNTLSDIRVARAPLGHEEALAPPAAPTGPSETSSITTTQSTLLIEESNDRPSTDKTRQEKNVPGRPSRAKVIQAAIEDYAKSDPRLDRPRFERYRSYRAYARSQGYDIHRDAGFSDKTFEKYEREFRRKSK